MTSLVLYQLSSPDPHPCLCYGILALYLQGFIGTPNKHNELMITEWDRCFVCMCVHWNKRFLSHPQRKRPSHRKATEDGNLPFSINEYRASRWSFFMDWVPSPCPWLIDHKLQVLFTSLQKRFLYYPLPYFDLFCASNRAANHPALGIIYYAHVDGIMLMKSLG